MKKFLSCLFVFLLSVNLFFSQTSGNVVKRLEGKTFVVHYTIIEEDDGSAILKITDDNPDKLEVRIFYNTVNEAYRKFFEIESELLDFYDEEEREYYYSSIPYDFVKNNVVFYLIDHYFEDSEWVKDESTGEYYYEIYRRTEPIYHDKDAITITVLDYQDATAPNSFDDNKYVWEAFERAHPNIIIEREPLFDEPFHQKTEAYASTGKMPDVFYMWPAGRSYIIHEKKLAKDLTSLLKKDGIYDDYSPVCLLPSQQKGGYVAEIPFGLTLTNCMFANTKVLKECGLRPATTYEELKAQLPILKAAGKELIIMANQDDWVMQSCLFSMVCGRMAGASWADDILEGKAKFTDEPFKSAVRMIQRMYDDGVISQISLATPYGDVTGMFANEKGAYLIDGDWRAGAFMTDASTGYALISPERQASDIELIQFPSLPGEKLHGSNSGTLGVGYGMSSSIKEGSAKEAAAWELIKWLSGPEMQQRRLDTGVSFPSLIRGVSFEGLEPIVAKRADFYTQPTATTPVLDSVFSSGVASVANYKLQELGLGKISVDEACEAIQVAYEAEW